MDDTRPQESWMHKQREIFYTNATLWDILVDSSNVIDDELDSSLMLQEKRIASMVCNLDELLRTFIDFIGDTCSNDEFSDEVEKSEADTQCTKETQMLNGSVQLTDRLALILKFNQKTLHIKSSNRIKSEFEKCGMTVNLIFEQFATNEVLSHDDYHSTTYEDIDLKPPSYQPCLNEESSLSIKPEGKESTNSQMNLWDHGETNENSELITEDMPLYSDDLTLEADLDINDVTIPNYTSKFSRKRPKKAGRPRGSKMKSTDSTVGRFRRLGYYPDYCVSEELYKETIEKGSPYCCPLCQKMYKERRSLEKHFAGTVNNKCPGVPVEKPTYKLEDGVYYCTQPGCEHEIAIHGAKSMGVIWTHHQSEHLSKDANLPYSCDQCPKSFPLHSILASHIASTHDLKKCSQICDVCGKTIAGSKNKIKQHMLVHTGEKIKCTQCDITFSRPGSLRRHMQHQHNINPQRHFCDICGKSWNSRSALNEHRESHKVESEENLQQEGQLLNYN